MDFRVTCSTSFYNRPSFFIFELHKMQNQLFPRTSQSALLCCNMCKMQRIESALYLSNILK